jgi:hypothetical protein
MSFPWLLGFGAFLLGMAVGLVTLGCWWRWRDRLGRREIAAIGALLVVGYLGHLVALGLTAMGLGILAVLAEGDRRARIGRTALAMLPVGPLAVLYKITTAGSGAFGPTWEHLNSWSDPRAWARQLGWADPITLGRRAYPPLWEEGGPWWGWLLIAPALWFAVGLAAAALRAWGKQGKEARPWAWLAAIGLLGALVGPDSFGADHGHYLPQRLALFGLAAAVVAVGSIERKWLGRVAVGAWGVALAVQSLTVWDYARESSARVGAMMAASAAVGEEKNIGTLLAEPRGRFRANPLLHADCLLGVGTGNVVWSNYETRFYYFPVQVRPGLAAPPAGEFEAIAIMVDPSDQAERARRWEGLMRTHGRLIDRIVVFGDPGAIELGGPVRFAEGPVRVAEPGARPE